MVVPARPVSGSPIDSTWGGIAHDAAVAYDFQVGTVTTVHTAQQTSPTVAVTFPRPFAAGSTPTVMVTSNNFNYGVGLNGSNPTATGFVAASWRYSGAASGTLVSQWFAYGPRA